MISAIRLAANRMDENGEGWREEAAGAVLILSIGCADGHQSIQKGDGLVRRRALVRLVLWVRYCSAAMAGQEQGFQVSAMNDCSKVRQGVPS